MKKILIFLMLFAFGFGAYCEVLLHDGYHTKIPGWLAVFNFPAPGEYRIVYDMVGLPDEGIAIRCYNSSTGENILLDKGYGGSSYEHTVNVGPPYAIKILGYNDTVMRLRVYGPSVGEPPVITSSLNVDAEVGTPFVYRITAAGDPTIVYSASGYPDYLSYGGTANDTVSCVSVPVGSTNFSFSITAANEFGSDTKTVNVIVAPAYENVVITSPLVVNGVAGEAFSYTTTATGSPVIVFGSSALPSYFTGNGASVFGVIPEGTTGSIYFNVFGGNGTGDNYKMVTVNIGESGDGPEITSPLSVPVTPGQVFSYTITAIGDPVIIFGGSSLPAYLSYYDGVISGTIPVDVSNFSFGIYASNSFGTDSKVVNAGNVGTGDGIVDTDDDVPTINAFKNELIAFLDIQDLEQKSRFNQMWGLMCTITEVLVDVIGETTLNIKDDTEVIKTNVMEINSKLTNINDLISLMNANSDTQNQKLESIKSVLDEQLTTQNSILELLEQIADPPSPETPPLPDDPGNPEAPEYSLNLTPDHEPLPRELQTYEKTFPMFDSALAQRDGTLPFVLVLPLSQISPLLSDVQINFSEGAIGSLVSGFRALLCSLLFYFTLKYWFLAVRRITD